MRRIAFTVSVVTFLLVSLAAFGAGKEETVDQLKARFESAHLEDRADLGIRIAQHQLRNADKLYIEGKVDQAAAAVDDIVAYSEKARDASMQTKKRLKNVEIDVRKIAEKLRDIKRTLAFEDQPPVDKAIRRLEDIRTALLKEMFAKDNKK
jgi:DNA mismatch repair ATPase MutS